jgi:hypothetical protein
MATITEACIENSVGMYHESNNLRTDEKIDNGKLVKELSDEKNKLLTKYQNLLEEVHKWMDVTERPCNFIIMTRL